MAHTQHNCNILALTNKNPSVASSFHEFLHFSMDPRLVRLSKAYVFRIQFKEHSVTICLGSKGRMRLVLTLKKVGIPEFLHQLIPGSTIPWPLWLVKNFSLRIG